MGHNLVVIGWTHDTRITPDYTRLTALISSIFHSIPHDADGYPDYDDPKTADIVGRIDPNETVFYDDISIDDVIAQYQDGAETYLHAVSGSVSFATNFHVDENHVFIVTGGSSDDSPDPYEGWSNLVAFTDLAAYSNKVREACGFVCDGIMGRD